MKYFTSLASLIIGLLLFFTANWAFKDFNPSELGLGLNTTSHVAKMKGIVKSARIGDLDSVLLSIKKVQRNSPKHQLAVWIGNSQLHAINQYKHNDLLAVQYSQQMLEELNSNISLFQFSSPHLNIIEEQIYMNTLRVESIKPDYLILPITFRSFHFIKIREELKKLAGYKEITKSIANSRVADLFFLEESNDKRGKLLSKDSTWQDRSEEYLNSLMERNIPFYKYKDNTKSYIKFLPTLAIHEMTDKSRDPQVSGNREIIEINMLSLTEIIQFAKSNNIEILMYQVPHPQDDQYFFYNREAYKDFFASIEKIASRSDNVHYIKLESIIPNRLWGINNDGFKDMYHFQSEGHKILGDTIAQVLHDLEKNVAYAF